jgi:hypothetical protein
MPINVPLWGNPITSRSATKTGNAIFRQTNQNQLVIYARVLLTIEVKLSDNRLPDQKAKVQVSVCGIVYNSAVID